MKNVVVAIALLSLAFSLPGMCIARAQDLSVPPPNMLPPPPPPPPPPSMAIPRVPKMDEIRPPTRPAPSRRGSFGDRVIQCIEEGGATGLGPNERAAYSRACANR